MYLDDIDYGYSDALEDASGMGEIFDVVKRVVRDFLSVERPGLMLGISDLGGKPKEFVGAFYPVGSNIIVINKTPLKAVAALKPELYNAYCFHLLLHEYLHSLGILDEMSNRRVTALVSENAFGKNHPVTVISKDFSRVFPEVFYASMGWKPKVTSAIEIIGNFDNGNVSYIG